MWNYRLTFESPWYLLLLVLVPFLWWFSFRWLRAFGIVRRLTAIGLRTLVLVLFIFALAGVQMVRISDRMTTIFLLDESLSVPESRRHVAARYVNAAIRKYRKRDDRAGVVVFGRESAIEIPPYDDNVQMMDRVESPLEVDYTNIAAAMRLAEASFPEDGARRVVLISDGNENVGNAMEQAQGMAAAGVGIDVLPVRFRPRGEIIVERLAVPNDVRRGQPFDLKVVVTNAGVPTARRSGVVRGRLQISKTQQGQAVVVSEGPVELPPGKKVFTIRQTMDAAGFYTYTARFIPDRPEDDAMEQNNRASAFTQIRGKGQILLIENAEQRGQYDRMVEALRRENLDVTLRSSSEAFASLAELQQYDSVILANIPREDFSDEQIEMLVRNTQQLGAGLIMMGATASFGAGGWANTELEKAMPVDFQIKSAKVVPRGALAMLMHASEIADGNNWQKKIGVAALEALGARDYCGVTHYDQMGRGPNSGMAWLWKPGMAVVGVNRNMMKARLTNMMPGDMPDFQPGMQLCLDGLVKLPEAAVKHVIVISDGDPSPPNAAVMNALVKNKITVSTVAIGAHGPAESKTMADMASKTGGKYYKVNNPNALPRIFQREARRVAQPLVYENKNGFRPQIVLQQEIVNGIPNPLPPITGFVLTSKKENPLVEVSILSPQPAKQDNCTLLASWTYGLGKAVAFTTDAGRVYTSQWTGWENYDKFFSQMVRWSMRPVEEEGKFTVATDFKDGQVRVVVTALDKNDEFQNFLDMAASAVAPDLKSIDLKMEQTAPGRYVGAFSARDPGSYMVMLSPGPGKAPLRTGFNVPFSDEFRGQATNETLLEQLARLKPKGGAVGKLINAPQEFTEREFEKLLAIDPFRHDLLKATSSQDVWYYALLAASCLFFFDIFIRRVQVSFAWAPRLAGQAWNFVLRRTPQAPPPETMDRLRSKKAEVSNRLEQLKASTRFEAPSGTVVDTRMLDEQLGSPTPPPSTPAAPSLGDTPQEEGYTSRLLKAKKKAWDQKEPKKE